MAEHALAELTRRTLRFQGKVAIVTGGSSGIGLATVRQLLDEGASVSFTCLPADGDANKWAYSSEHHGSCDEPYSVLLGSEKIRVMEFVGDMSSQDFCTFVVKTTVERFGRVDFLVNNAFSFNATGMDSTRADWEKVMSVGPLAYASMTQLVARDIESRDAKGAIVNVSSISAHVSQPNRWTYNAAKGAVSQLTKCSALDLGKRGIRVNSVSPGWVWTREVAKAAVDGGREAWEPIWGDFHMLGRLAETRELGARRTR